MKLSKYTISSVSLAVMLTTGTLKGQHLSESQQSEPGWLSVGADIGDVVNESGMTIPASAQVYRSVGTDGTLINLRMLPDFGEDAANMPIFEFGEFALSFSQEDQQVQVRFFEDLQGEGELIYQSQLSSGTNGADELTLEIARNDRAVAIGFADGQFHREFAAKGPTAELVLSSGTHSDWHINHLSISELSAVSLQDSGPTGLSVSEQASLRQDLESLFGFALSESQNDRVGLGSTTEGQLGEVEDPATKESQTARSNRGLEIFTPPSVRKGRADLIREVISEKTTD